MNHKWNDNTCIHCGLKRERKEYKKLQRTYSRLGRDGCFYDVPVYQFGTGWHYGEPHKFNRPDCKSKLKVMQDANSNIEVYQQLLQMFTSKDHRQRDWLREPFLVGRMAAASNSYSLVAVPEWTNAYEDRSDKLKSIYPVKATLNVKIEVEELRDALLKVPLIDEYDDAVGNCDACRGEGDVDFDFYYDGKYYQLEGDCPICEGDGRTVKKDTKPNGKKKPDSTKLIRIGKNAFDIKRVEELINVADMLNSTSVTLTHESKVTVFKIENVDVLLAPVVGGDNENICATVSGFDLTDTKPKK